mgnify:CR=1 FL=1
MKQRIRVVGLIKNEEGVLIFKRSRGRSESPVFWELPTGKIKFGEQYSKSPLEGDKVICLKNEWQSVGSNAEPLVNGVIGTIHNLQFKNGRLYKPEMIADFMSDTDGEYRGLHMDYKIFTEKEPTVNKDNWMMYPKNARAYEFDYAYACTVHK